MCFLYDFAHLIRIVFYRRAHYYFRLCSFQSSQLLAFVVAVAVAVRVDVEAESVSDAQNLTLLLMAKELVEAVEEKLLKLVLMTSLGAKCMDVENLVFFVIITTIFTKISGQNFIL